MKKFLSVLLILTLFAAPALAEKELTAQVLGTQTVDHADLTILRVDIREDGADLPSVYALIESPWLLDSEYPVLDLQDVNFDGHEDLVVITAAGASNTMYTFFLWDEAAGAFSKDAVGSVWNYQLYPAQGLVQSYGVSGFAGLLHEIKVYGWEDGQLRLLRSSVWDTLTETQIQTVGDHTQWTEHHDDSVLVETYTDYVNGAEQVETFPIDDYMNNDIFMSQRFLYEDEFLQLDALTDGGEDGTNG